MADTGYVRLYRALLGHHAFRNDAEAMAFAWLIMRAAWQPVKVRYRGRSFALNRGQLVISMRDFAAAMDRPKGWVERLFSRLRDGTMIETQGETVATVVTICNYDAFQGEKDTRGTLDRTPDGERAGHAQDTEQRKEEIKKKEITTSSYAFEGRTIRLTQADYDRWRKRYFTITDLDGELGALDDWFESHTDETRKKWFHITSASLNKKHQANLAKAAKDEEWELPIA